MDQLSLALVPDLFLVRRLLLGGLALRRHLLVELDVFALVLEPRQSIRREKCDEASASVETKKNRKRKEENEINIMSTASSGFNRIRKIDGTVNAIAVQKLRMCNM